MLHTKASEEKFTLRLPLTSGHNRVKMDSGGDKGCTIEFALIQYFPCFSFSSFLAVCSQTFIPLERSTRSHLKPRHDSLVLWAGVVGIDESKRLHFVIIDFPDKAVVPMSAKCYVASADSNAFHFHIDASAWSLHLGTVGSAITLKLIGF